MKKTNILVASTLAVSIALSGCATKQQTGTAIGAGLGGVACNLLTKNSPNAVRFFATAGCAAVGGFVGNKIGKALDDRDKVALAAATQNALNSKGEGTYNWTSEHSGATAEIKVGKPFVKTEQVQIKRTVAVQPVASMEKLNAQYLTIKGANVRAAPSASGAKLGFLQEMTQFTAMGKTGDWIMVGRKGVAVGYVHNDLVQSKASYEAKLASTPSKSPVKAAATAKAAPRAEEAKPMVAATPAQEPQKVEVVPAQKLDDASPATQPELGKLTEAAPVTANTVSAETTCRSMESTVKDAKGKIEKASSNTCKKAEEDTWADA